MSALYTVIKYRERIELALGQDDVQALRAALRELSDFAASEPVCNELQGHTDRLASCASQTNQRGSSVTNKDTGALTEEFCESARELTHQVCRCYLRTADLDPDKIPTVPGTDIQKTVGDIETALARRSEADQEMLLWAVRAKAALTHQTATPEVVEELVDAVSELDTDRSHLEASRKALNKAIEREQETNEQAAQIDDLADEL